MNKFNKNQRKSKRKKKGKQKGYREFFCYHHKLLSGGAMKNISTSTIDCCLCLAENVYLAEQNEK